MLTMYGIKNCDTIKKARRWLEAQQIEYRFHDYRVDGLDRELLDKRTAGVGSDALTSAYEIILRVEYSISNANGIITPLDTSARTSRTYNYNVNNANSAAQEEELVLREMRRELANTILRRVKNLSAKATSIPTPAAQ